MKKCSVDGCENKLDAKTFCKAHYHRNARYGSPVGGPTRDRSRQLGTRDRAANGATLAERFWPKVHKTEGCWEWTARRMPRGYGQIGFEGKTLLAHRVSYELAYGEIPQGMVIDHKCHRPECVNPDHLQAVTQRLNSENRGYARSNTGVRGVSWNKKLKKYEARAGKDGKVHYAGTYPTVDEAEVAAITLRNSLFTNNLEDRRAAA